VPATAVPGGVVHVTLLGGANEGETVTPVLFSTPRPLATAVVDGGAFSVTIPADAALGAHKLAVVDAQGALIGWGALTLVAAPGSTDPGAGPAGTGADTLASTGSSVTLPLGIASGALLAGVAALLLALWRRRTATRAATEGSSQE